MESVICSFRPSSTTSSSVPASRSCSKTSPSDPAAGFTLPAGVAVAMAARRRSVEPPYGSGESPPGPSDSINLEIAM